jgi:hypothetical protein
MNTSELNVVESPHIVFLLLKFKEHLYPLHLALPTLQKNFNPIKISKRYAMFGVRRFNVK